MLVFGLDGGIASLGWAVLDFGENGEGRIAAAGSRGFDPPETAKEGTPTNRIRRLMRGQRRVVRRRRQRMSQVRQLLHAHGLLAAADRDALRLPEADPWSLRAEGLDRALSATELAAALGHIARHRGFRSNSKRDVASNAADETSKMLKAMAATKERIAQWRTVGEMMARDPAYAVRKRNRGGDFSHSLYRDDQEHEVRRLLAAQRRCGQGLASDELEAAFIQAAFDQRPLQDSENMLAACPFERAEKRTARRGYSFERFRLLSRLNAIRLATARGPLPLTPEQVTRIADSFAQQKSITFKSVRRLLELAPSTRFADVNPDEETRDIVARNSGAAEGSYTLRDWIGPPVWLGLLHHPAKLDRIAEVLTFREAKDRIRLGLEEVGLEPALLERLIEGVEAGKFSAFTGAGHISAKAARAIIPGLARGMVYSEACAEAGYNHAEQAEIHLDDIRNPTVQRALAEMLKQVRVMNRSFGAPNLIHVELARDIGKSAEERDEITRGIEKRNKLKDAARARFTELVGVAPSEEELLRFELWEEQGCKCLYTETAISPMQLRAGDASIQVDHILPWGRFGDDSFNNKTICTARANQEKRGRTPFEWFQQEKTADEWERFRRRVEECARMKGRKKRGCYLRQNAAEVEDAFKTRNLNDTRYIARMLAGILGKLYGAEGERRIRARPGALTAKLRRAWGLERLKKGPDGERLEDDRNHAVDAIIVAACSEAMLQQLTRAAQEAERKGLPRDWVGHVPLPFGGFREAVVAARDAVFVSRSERRRARGQAHDATIRQVRERDGEKVVFARRSVMGLKESDLDKIKDVERNAVLRAVLAEWIKAGSPKDRLPRFPILGAAAQADLDAGVAAAFVEDWRATSDLAGAERREARRLLRRRFEVEHPAEHARILAEASTGTPAGPEIRTVLVAVKDKPALMLRGGTAQRGEMVRVDVFREMDVKGRARFYLVPIYPHQVADQKTWPVPPNAYVVGSVSPNDWPTLRQGSAFRFSLYPNSLLEVSKSDGEVIRGYFKGLDISTAAIHLAMPHSQRAIRKSIGAKTLLRFEKLSVDRLGQVSLVPEEVRTWHGVACT